jgi:leader peptidase (prepilin peptidase) / N-methyltransferase
VSPAAHLLELFVTCVAVMGLAAGSFATTLSYRVPAGIPLHRDSRCATCGGHVTAAQSIPVVSWLMLRGRCARCRAAIPLRHPVVEASTAAAFVLVAMWIVRSQPDLPADVWPVLACYLYFAGVSVTLTLIDVDVHRLPNGIVLPSYVVGVVLFAVACILGSPWTDLLRAVVGMIAMLALYVALRLISPRGMGGGDVKLAGLVGLFLGWAGWGPLAVGAFAGFALGGLFGISLLVLRRAHRTTAIPFGPWMLAGAWVGLLWGDLIGGLAPGV